MNYAKHWARHAAAALLLCFGSAQAATATASSSTGALALVKVLLALALVLAAIVVVAWLLRRMSPMQHGSRFMRVIGTAAIGQRERLVLVEIGETWFVLGVGPGHIMIVHTLPKQPAAPTEDVENGRAEWLTRIVQRRKL